LRLRTEKIVVSRRAVIGHVILKLYLELDRQTLGVGFGEAKELCRAEVLPPRVEELEAEAVRVRVRVRIRVGVRVRVT
jgi:hypothetical protein